MEYLVSLVIIVLVVRYGFPALITWFFERFVVLEDENSPEANMPVVAPKADVSNAQKIATVRKGLEDIKHRLEKS